MNSSSRAAEHDLRDIAEKETWMLDLLGVESRPPFAKYGLQRAANIGHATCSISFRLTAGTKNASP